MSAVTSPISKLQSLAENGNQQARNLIDRYADLEVLATLAQANVDAVRAEYVNKFEAFERVVSNAARIVSSPDSFSMDSDTALQLIQSSYDSLIGQLNDAVQHYNESDVQTALADAAYLTTNFDKDMNNAV